ncbi:hypothetical protein ACPOL_3465 [Acidisarcina polymorpha]|uniref:Uncharacterized protein n=1 Tax=Acidisarcina polymorpha TaxID=2211140 RepID=A0A2Z5G162_9BACT|nr:hypothetical protein [Acidisarcina polymorpha]AXC12750.1 hypothetical protein ACPOL_3465 [Acidisarcina polymorpha]
MSKIADFREDSRYGLQWFRPAWQKGELLKVKQLLRGQSFPTVDAATPAYLDEIKDVAPVIRVNGHTRPSVRIVRGASYSVESLVTDAKRSKDLKDSPQVSFVTLQRDDDLSALKFIDTFGPLFWPQKMLAVADWIHLDDFWARHARFLAISKLWRSLRDGEQAIQDAWKWIEENLTATRIAGEPDLGSDPTQTIGTGKRVNSIAVPMPWQANKQMLKVLPSLAMAEGRFNDEVVRISSSAMNRTLAIALIQHELTRQTESAKTLWRIEDGVKNLRCIPERRIESLWSAMWEIFAAEAGSGLSWRFCKACGKPFYPKRIDSDCCTTAEQSAWSKSNYAARWAQKGR